MENPKSGIYRSEFDFDKGFTRIPNEWIRNKRLSAKSKGLLVYLLSHEVGYNITLNQVEREMADGKAAIRSAIAELIEAGYLRTEMTKDARGYNAGLAYYLQNPECENPTLENPTLENRTALRRTLNKEDKDKRTNAQILEPEFDLFWEMYPRKVGKKAARLAYSKAVGSNGSVEILTGAQRLANDPNLPEPRFIPHPATWLNEGRWEDELYPERPKSSEQVVETSKKKLERDKEITQSLIAEMQEAKAKTSAPPKCKHGNSIALCKPCLKALN